MKKNRRDNPAEPVGLPADPGIIRSEVVQLAYENVLTENARFAVVRAWPSQIPNALYEVGRLRELAFRETGRGTGRRVDLDQFDLYYLHLLIWCKETQEIAGACRIGQVDIVLKRYGRDGLYTGHLFPYSPAFVREEGPTLEISKAFVREEYRGFAGPISLFCRGIGRFISQNPDYRNLIGLGSSRRHVVKGSRARGKATDGSSTYIYMGSKCVPGSLRLGGTIAGKGSVLAFVDLAGSPATLRHCMGKEGSQRFVGYHLPRHDRAA